MQRAPILIFKSALGGPGEDDRCSVIPTPVGAGVLDVDAKALQWAVGSGIINGKDGKIVAKGNASRAEAATMIQRFCALIAE